MKELCRACLCVTSRPFYLKSDVEIRNYELATGVQWANLPILPIQLCYRCHKLIAKITTFRQCCHVAEKYFSRCVGNTDEINNKTTLLPEQSEIYELLSPESKNDLGQTPTLCFDSTTQGFASDDKPFINGGSWKCVSWGDYESVYYHERGVDMACNKFDIESDEDDNFYDPDDTVALLVIKSEISQGNEKKSKKGVKKTRRKRNYGTLDEADTLASKWITKSLLTTNQVLESMAAYRRSGEYTLAEYKCEPCARIFTTELLSTDHRVKHDESSGKFKCEMCGQRLATLEKLRVHRRYTHTRVYRCSICNKRLCDRNAALKHVLRFHKKECLDIDVKDGDETVTCEVCGKVVKNELSLRIHARVHDDARNFKCDYCPKVYALKSRLKQHLRSHTGARPHACAKCGAMFAARGALVAHAREHEARAAFACVPCGRLYRTRAKYNEHMKIGARHVRPETIKYACSWCPRRFLRSRELDTHVARAHLGQPLVKNYVCHQCGNAYARRRTLQEHLLRHAGLTPHICPHCPRSFFDLPTLKEHLRSQHDEENLEYPCKQCPAVLSLADELRTHVRDVHRQYHGTLYKCEQCDKQFKTKYGLKTHALHHSGQKPHGCVDCGRSFSILSNLKRHRRAKHEGSGVPAV